MKVDKSKEVVKYSIMALVFVVWYYLTGSENAIENTMHSVVLVVIASVIAFLVIKEQKKKGRLQAL